MKIELSNEDLKWLINIIEGSVDEYFPDDDPTYVKLKRLFEDNVIQPLPGVKTIIQDKFICSFNYEELEDD